MHALEPFQSLIKERCGFAFKANALHTLETSIKQRMTELGLTELVRYLRFIQCSEDELHHLIDLVTVNETYFLREKQHFQVLADLLEPRLSAGAAKPDKIKILSAGCSTGEEAYSILITLIERYGSGVRDCVAIYGIDIDRGAIKIAAEGVYRSNSFRNDKSWLLRYFVERADNSYELLPEIKRGVDFQVGNLLSMPSNPLQMMDVIFYRNVSIYFERDVQQRIFKHLTHRLNPGGYIFLGSSETYGHDVGILPLIERGNVFVYHKKNQIEPQRSVKAERSASSARKPLKSRLHTAAGTASPAPAAQISPVLQLFDAALQHAKHKENSQAMALIEEILLADGGFVKAYGLKAALLINRQQFSAATDVCQHILTLDEWSLEGYLLLGWIAKLTEDYEAALKQFKVALYLRSTCWLVHFFLAEVYFVQQDVAGALREYTLTLKLLEKQGIDDHGLTFFPLAFSVEQLVNLIRHNIDKIGRLQSA